MDVRVWTIKKAEPQRIDTFELWCWGRLLRVFLRDCKEIQPVYPKGDQSWIFIGRTDAEAETPILWPPYSKYWLIGKDPDAWKDWRQEEKGLTEDEMVGWHHRLDGHEFEQTPGVGDGQGGLVCYSSWGCKESDITEWLNWLTVVFIWASQVALLVKNTLANSGDVWDLGLIPESGWCSPPPWRRTWQPTPVFLPGKSHGQMILAGCRPWGCKELDTTEAI